MKIDETVDWIVVGNGLAGASLSYELVKVGFSVLLLEQSPSADNATRYSYGGIAYWSGTTDLNRQLCQEGIDLHRSLSAELEGDTQFREVDLLLAIAPERDPDAVIASYASFAIPPTLLSSKTACEIEPLLDPEAIAAVLHCHHAQVSPIALVEAYNQAFVRLGGTIQTATVSGLLRSGDRVTGVLTSTNSIQAANVVVCAGGMSRALLQESGCPMRLYFTHAEVIEIPATDLQLRSIVMPAEVQRFAMEAKAGNAMTDSLWNQAGQEVAEPILDAGAVQFQGGRLLMGQLSRALTDPHARVDATQSEAAIRAEVGRLLPALQDLPGQWRHCLVSFSGDRLPLIGSVSNLEGVYLFAGFSNPFAILPPLARRFAHHLAGAPDPVVAQLSPDRFSPNS